MMAVSWRTVTRAAGVAALAVAALAGASGCSVAVATEGDPIASRTMTGGLCPDGPCNEEFVVHDDGVWTWEDHRTGRSLAGRLHDWELDLMTQAIAETAIAESPPFTDICPTAYDGMEVVYGWAGGAVSSCDLRVDPDDPLAAVMDALADDARRQG